MYLTWAIPWENVPYNIQNLATFSSLVTIQSYVCGFAKYYGKVINIIKAIRLPRSQFTSQACPNTVNADIFAVINVVHALQLKNIFAGC